MCDMSQFKLSSFKLDGTMRKVPKYKFINYRGLKKYDSNHAKFKLRKAGYGGLI